jgi:Ca2+-binding RTX toxin-like protein
MDLDSRPKVYFQSSSVRNYPDRQVTVYSDADPNPFGIETAELTIYNDRDYGTLDFYVPGIAEPVISVSGTKQEATGYFDTTNCLGGLMDGHAYLNGRWTIYGTKYDDVLLAGGAQVTFHGNEGNDLLVGDNRSDTMFGGAGNDQIFGESYGYWEAQGDELHGGGGNDIIAGSLGDDRIYGESGDDTLYASDRNYAETDGLPLDTFYGGDGNDYIVGGWEDFPPSSDSKWIQTFHGGNGTDTIFGLYGRDLIYGGDGDDTLHGGSLSDTIYGGKGADLLDADVVPASSEGADLDTDSFYGGDGRDSLLGGAANDFLFGGEGKDRLDGGTGKDKLSGGAGEDEFLFTASLSGTNADTIVDFSPAKDTIRLGGSVFKDLTYDIFGVLSKGAFAANTSGNAKDASDRIIYETDTGKLFYDKDGTGGAARVQFAAVDPSLNLTHQDFIVI